MFIEPGHSLIDPAPPAYALLSQNVRQQLQDLRPADGPVLNPADDHLDMLQDRLRPGCVRRLGRWRRGLPWGHRGLTPASGGTALVEVPLFVAPFLALVIGDTAPRRLLLAVGFTAAKGTAQVLALAAGHILAPGIARVGEKEDAAVPTSGQAPSPLRLPSQRSQHLIVLQDPRPNLGLAIPVPAQLKISRNRYCKKAKLSLKMLS
jgi:hypothetical protein